MKLTRKHLNYILHNLPDPRLAEQTVIQPYIQVPVHKVNELLRDALLPRYKDSDVEIKNLRFRYDKKEMDWVLEDLEI